MNAEPSPRPWRVESDNLTLRPPVCFVVDANGAKVSGGFFSHADAALICDAVNLKTRFDEAMTDEAGYLHPVVLDGKPMVCVTPPPSEAEESRMHREYEASLLADRERFRRGYYEAAELNDRLRDLVRRLSRHLANYITSESENDLLRDARAAIGEDAK